MDYNDIEQILLNYDISNENFIASGENGKAYHLNDNLVLKLSLDEAEAMNAFYLKENKLKYFVKYYEIKQHSDFYILILDKVRILESREIQIFNFLKKNFYKIKNINNKYCYNILNYNLLTSNLFLFINNKKRLKKSYLKYINSNDCDINNFSWLELLKMYYSINNILIEAINNNLHIEDFISGNLGYNKNNDLVMFDVGNYSNFNYNIEK